MKKILQIIPAPEGMYAYYAGLYEDEKGKRIAEMDRMEPILCLALCDMGCMHLVRAMVCGEDGCIGLAFADEKKRFVGLVPPTKEDDHG